MVQDIGAGRFHNEYHPAAPSQDSLVTAVEAGKILAAKEGERLRFFTWKEYSQAVYDASLHFDNAGKPQHDKEESPGQTVLQNWRYLFRIDDTAWYLVPAGELSLLEEAQWLSLSDLRQVMDPVLRFGGVTAYQLGNWYHNRRLCPSCGTPMVHSETERMMQCPACHLMEYPKICPAVIVAVWHEDRLLLTKYAGRGYHHYALVAGFTEIGESIEDTVRREVMEETGVHVKNLHFYKSQPWSFTDTLLFGFFAELDGSERIHMDTDELSVAKWCTREEIPDDDGISLTREMMRVFRNKELDIF